MSYGLPRKIFCLKVDDWVQKSGHLCGTETHKRMWRSLPTRRVVFTWLELACKLWCMLELACKPWCMLELACKPWCVDDDQCGPITDGSRSSWRRICCCPRILCKMQQIPQHPPLSLTIPFLLSPPHFRKLTGYSTTCTQVSLSEILLFTKLWIWRPHNITIYFTFF
jgi:hypothetical protein